MEATLRTLGPEIGGLEHDLKEEDGLGSVPCHSRACNRKRAREVIPSMTHPGQGPSRVSGSGTALYLLLHC